MKRAALIRTLAGILSLSLVGESAPALAGFQWVAPQEGYVSTAPVPPVVVQPRAETFSSNSSRSSAPQVISPIVIQGSAPVAAGQAVSPVVIQGEASPVVSASRGSAEVLSSAPVVASRNGVLVGGGLDQQGSGSFPQSGVMAGASAGGGEIGDGGVVVGFAKQVPLSVALRQILPSGYSFSIDQGVDLGVLVSFDGGRPWRDTLRSALDASGLLFHEQAQMVTIARSGGDAVVDRADAAPAYRGGKQASTLGRVSSGSVDPIIASAGEVEGGGVVQSWSAQRGDTLHKILLDWSRRSSVEFEWKSEYDYPLQASVTFSGTFEDAVRSLLTGFEFAHPQPIAELHVNAGIGQTILVVSTRGNDYSN